MGMYVSSCLNWDGLFPNDCRYWLSMVPAFVNVAMAPVTVV
jgi:hypothetical protein